MAALDFQQITPWQLSCWFRNQHSANYWRSD